MKKILVVLGTRPEAIKLAPVILELKKNHFFSVRVCITSQHGDMIMPVLNFFQIQPDIDLKIMKKNQSLSELTATLISTLAETFLIEKPDAVMIQGDTTTTFATALVSFYHKIKVIHIEAGLRTHNNQNPFPEELNRTLTSQLADIHFAPTEENKNNLKKEGIHRNCWVVGNTVIDALNIGLQKIKENHKPYDAFLSENGIKKNFILITLHRRESFGPDLESVCEALKTLSKQLPQYQFIYPVHPNPNIHNPVHAKLGNSKNILLLPPLDYPKFIHLMSLATLILSDSGGIQEEAPSLNIPILILRDETERKEVLEMGLGVLVGTKKETIVAKTLQAKIGRAHV